MGTSGVEAPVNSQAVEGHRMTSPSLDYRLIPLSQGQFAKVDAADYEWLNHWKWNARWAANTKTFYALRHIPVADDPKRPSVYMHRLILGLERFDKRHGDHVNLDTLDNRRTNLRVATAMENHCNQGVRKDSRSGYKGVGWHKTNKKWQARIRINNARIRLGWFNTPEEAHAAYCEAAAKLHGVFANTGIYSPSKFACWCGDSNCTEHP
jgi:hypothetical protein